MKDLFDQICKSERVFLSYQEYPEYGKIVQSGPIMGVPYDFEHAIGYVTQIRKGRGEFGSDQYLIRHADGTLATHENQAFWLVPEDLAEKALSLFKQKPDQEGGDTEYTIANEFPEKGYIIEFKDGDPRGDSPAFGITITSN